MTYYEILKSAYEFLMHEEIEEDMCLEAFCCQSTKNEEFQQLIKKLYTYLELYLLNKKGILSKVHQKLLSLLEKRLTIEAYSATKTFEVASQKSQNNMQERLIEIEETLRDTIDDLDEETKETLQNGIFDEYFSELTKNLKNRDRELETEIVESTYDNMLETIIPSIPYLFFTEVGYKYIPSRFHISDEKLRDECFNYYKDLTYSFYLYHSEYGKERLLWLIMIKTLEYMFLLIGKKDFVKLKRFIEIDKHNLYEANECLINCLLSYPEDIDLDLETVAFDNTIIPENLYLFIACDTIFSEFTPYQVSNMIIGYFKQVRNKEKAMKNLISKLPKIKGIFASQEDEDQKRVRVYKSSWKMSD